MERLTSSRVPTIFATSTIEAPQIEISGPGSGRGGWQVVVFNNDTNTYDEVIQVLMDATGCSLQEAGIEAWEIDHLGKSAVHFASESECERAARIIGRIGIQVEVSQEA